MRVLQRLVVLLPWAFALGVLLAASPALARQNGMAADGCGGCHGSTSQPSVTITSDTPSIALGQTITLTITVQNTNGGVAGFYFRTSGVGTLKVVDTVGTKVIGPGIGHAKPGTASGTGTQFRVGWTAPATPGGVDFFVYALSGNNDGSPRGDGAGEGFLSVPFGCAGTKFYRDFDGDGFGGTQSGYTINCAKPQYYATVGGDCNDSNEKIFPGQPELCDGKDNNCNGMIDEGLPITQYCQDDDNDGHGVVGKMTKMDCGVSKGFGVCDGDCDEKNAKIYPGAQEVCNNQDDNCNNRVDDDARETCGLGWCRRYGAGCNTTVCTPGKPRAEECNAFDDDCDGVDDNGTDLELCGMAGMICHEGNCITSGTVVTTPDGGSVVVGGPDVEDPRVIKDPDAGKLGACSMGRGGGAKTSPVFVVLAAVLAFRRRRGSVSSRFRQ
ncbi:MAG TPA: MopE-related protein [Polyangiaceae bacterium]|nr:MopE-related protein [Polyangiaceae bacterium]